VSLRVSLALMILFVALGYFAFFEPLRTTERDDLATEKAEHVAWFKGDRLARITVESEHPVSLECSLGAKGCPFDNSGQWLITPDKTVADSGAVGTLASSLLNLTHNGKVDFGGSSADSGFDPKEFGLDKPKATVSLALASTPPRSVVFKIGNPTPTGPNLYLSTSEDSKHLYLVPNYLVTQIDQEPFHWRDKRLFPGSESTAVNRVAFRSKKAGDIVAVKAGKEWRLEKPRAVDASDIMFEGLGSTLAYAAATKVYAPNRNAPEAKKALAAAGLDVSFGLNGGATHHMRLYQGNKQVLAVVDDREPVYVVDGATFDRFQKDLSEYRARAPLRESLRGQVDGLELRFPRDKQQTTLKLDKDMWTITGGDKPGDLMLSQGRLNAIVDALRDSDYRAFFPLKGLSKEAAAFRKETPDVVLTLTGGGKTIWEGKFLVFERHVALTESEGDVRALGLEFLKYLPVRLHDLTEPANQTVITEQKGAPSGNSAQPKSLSI
jgi:hypothetical protein